MMNQELGLISIRHDNATRIRKAPLIGGNGGAHKSGESCQFRIGQRRKANQERERPNMGQHAMDYGDFKNLAASPALKCVVAPQ
jgi:hypothetical protein